MELTYEAIPAGELDAIRAAGWDEAGNEIAPRADAIADGVLAADGEHAEQVIAELLDRPGAAVVHLRNVGYGCYNFAARRR